VAAARRICRFPGWRRRDLRIASHPARASDSIHLSFGSHTSPSNTGRRKVPWMRSEAHWRIFYHRQDALENTSRIGRPNASSSWSWVQMDHPAYKCPPVTRPGYWLALSSRLRALAVNTSTPSTPPAPPPPPPPAPLPPPVPPTSHVHAETPLPPLDGSANCSPLECLNQPAQYGNTAGLRRPLRSAHEM